MINPKVFPRPLFFAACLLVPAACAGDGELDESYLSGDGVRVATDEHPEVGLLVTLSGAICTGTLIGHRTVLTAAHCLDHQTDDQGTAPLGWFEFWHLQPPEPAATPVLRERIRFTRQWSLRPAPYWNSTIEWDIGVVHLERPAPLDVPRARLSRDNEWGAEVTLYGLGGSGDGCGEFDYLKRALDYRLGQGIYWQTCGGDSGGPVFRRGTNDVVEVHSGYSPIDGVLRNAVVASNWERLREILAESEALDGP